VVFNANTRSAPARSLASEHSMGSDNAILSHSVRQSGSLCGRRRCGSPRRHLWQGLLWTLSCTGLCAQTGCMSALTSATLREALRETATSLLEPTDNDDDTTPADHASLSASGRPVAQQEQDALPGQLPASPPAAKIPAMTLDEAIDKAVERLSGMGGIDPATRDVLIETLETTHPDDWPQVVDAFALSLEARRSEAASSQPVAAAAVSESAAVADAPLALAAAEPTVPAPIAPEISPPAAVDQPVIVSAAPPSRQESVEVVPVAHHPSQAAAVATALLQIEPAPASPVQVLEPEVPADAPEPPAVSGPGVRNACFATRVRAWGVVDRFSQAAFRPGQEVIVYFELENLQANRSAEGHTTSISTVFRLLAADGTPLGADITFDPVVETCREPRREFFARYVLRIPPGTPAGPCRLAWIVSDAVAGTTTTAHLDLTIVAPTE